MPKIRHLGAIDPEGNRFDLSIACWDMEHTKADMTEDEWNALHPGGVGAGG